MVRDPSSFCELFGGPGLQDGGETLGLELGLDFRGGGLVGVGADGDAEEMAGAAAENESGKIFLFERGSQLVRVAGVYHGGDLDHKAGAVEGEGCGEIRIFREGLRAVRLRD